MPNTILVKADIMKRIEGTMYVECDLCWKKSTWTSTCCGCGHTVCIMCLLKEKFECPVCGGNYHQPFPNKRI